MIIDVHHHCVSPRALERVLAEPATYGIGEDSANLERLRWWYQYSNLEQRKVHLHEMGADGAVLSTSPGLHRYTAPLEQERRLCRVLNDGLAEWIDGEPLFRGMASVPLQDGPAAAEELRRATEELGLRGALLITHIGGRNLDAPDLEPFWEMAEGLQAPIFLHPNPLDVVAQERLGSRGLELGLGVAMDGTIAAASLVRAGVLDRHPRLHIVLSHGGWYFPIAFARLTYAYRNDIEDGRGASVEPPEAYLRRFYYDTVLYHPAPLHYLVRLVGADRLLLGTDYPYTPEFRESVRIIEALGLAANECEAILGGTAAELFSFEVNNRSEVTPA